MTTTIYLTEGDDIRDYAGENDPLQVYALGGNDDITGGAASDYIDGGNGNDTLTGGAGNDHLEAGSGQDVLNGGDGDDTLVADGSFADGMDTLIGGNGNDTYILGGLNFAFQETDPGQDLIEISSNFSLANLPAIENLLLTGTAAINGTGNDADNIITGNDAANVLDGGAGSDRLVGLGGDDELIGNGGDALYGDTGNDSYFVSETSDTLYEAPGEGTDTVHSSVDFTLTAAMGEIENLTLTGAAGHATGNDLDNTITGTAGSNEINGGGGLDTLIGGYGDDVYVLNDVTYFKPNQFTEGRYVFDTVEEVPVGGNDTIILSPLGTGITGSTYAYTLPDYVENADVAAGHDFDLAGNALDNRLIGNLQINTLSGGDGDDTLNGGAGLDTLIGGNGNDAYTLGDVTTVSGQGQITRGYFDTVQESAGGGIDTINISPLASGPYDASYAYTLPNNVETIQVFEGHDFDLTGNALDNSITGNDSVNTLSGLDGNDKLNGRGGLDTLIGGNGNDTYVLADVTTISGQDQLPRGYFDTVQESTGGGTDTVDLSPLASGGYDLSYAYTLPANVENATVSDGHDFDVTGNALNNVLTGNASANTLTGGTGNDTFVFQPGGGADTITDFTAGADTDDEVDLTAFTSIRSFDAILAHASQSGGNTVFDFGSGDTLTLDGVAKASLSPDDFVLPKNPPHDFNADGMSDVLWQNNSGGPVSIWEMNGASILNSLTFNLNPSWHAIGTGDFNKDGFADILWQNTSGAVAIWEMKGANIVSNPTLHVNPGPSWHVIGTGDFNDDGKSDILWQNTSGAVSIWEMDGASVMSNPTLKVNPGPSWHVIDTGDFNDDGFSDILWQNANGAVSIWEMNGASVISNPTLKVNPGPSWHVIDAGDFNDDGKSDILWQNTNGAVSIWEMDGASVISNPTLKVNPGAAWHVINAADYNGDGKSDITWQNDNGAVSIWEMDGATILHNPTLSTNPGSSWHIIGPHNGLTA